MLEIFANPGYLAAGGALISSPIIIHLINRMRFKRLRWAAMEFLLKAQKRNRRRLIIEQLLLLLLRCLLVALVALLVSRLVERNTLVKGEDAREFTHIVLIDDSLSMSDRWKDKDDNNKEQTCLGKAKDIIKDKLLPKIGQSTTNDRLILATLSEIVSAEGGKLERPPFTDLSSLSRRAEVANLVTKLEGTKLHLDMAKGLEWVRGQVKGLDGGRVAVHVFTDLRASDWAMPAGKNLLDELRALARMKKADVDEKKNELKIEDVKVYVKDVAHPYRPYKASPVAPGYHDNLALTEFRAATRVAGKDMPVTFNLSIANYGAREAEVNVDVFDIATGKALLDIDFSPSMPLKIPAMKGKEKPMRVSFDKRFPAKEGQDSYFVQLVARVENKRPDALEPIKDDDYRYTALEIRNKVPVLVVDGEGNKGREEQRDSFFIERAVISIPGESNTVVYGQDLPTTGGLAVNALDRVDLSRYPIIFLLNVRDLTKPQVEKLDNFVKNGGAAVFFMGANVSSKFYNEQLYKDGAGLFPVPLKSTYYPPPNEDALKPVYTNYDQLLLRDEQYGSMDEYPILGQVFKEKKDLREALRNFPIKRYFKVDREQLKNFDPKNELATLPNEQPVREYRDVAVNIFEKKLPPILKDNPEYKQFKPGLEYHKDLIYNVVNPSADNKAHQLGKALMDLLQDEGKQIQDKSKKEAGAKKQDPKRPNLKEFWAYAASDPKLKSLRDEIKSLHDEVKYGDKFIILKKHGNGKVLAVMTTAGKEWNDWGGGSDAMVFYQPFIWESINYLTSQEAGKNTDISRIVGDPVTVIVEPDQYRQKGRDLQIVRLFSELRKDEAARPEKLFFAGLRGKEGTQAFAFPKNYKPGIYLTNLLAEGDPDDARPLAQYAHAFNVDTDKESKLPRVSTQELINNIFNEKERQDKKETENLVIGGVEESPGLSRTLGNDRPWDFSESPWFFLIFLAILVAEQALAVHLSFHLKSDKGDLPTVMARPQARAA